MAGSFPDFPQRLMVKGETRKIEATSLIVKRSGRSERLTFEIFFSPVSINIFYIIIYHIMIYQIIIYQSNYCQIK